MAKLYVQAAPIVFEISSSLAANGAASAGACCAGYARMVGGLFTDASSAAAGLRVEQSFDLGLNWNLISASNGVAACGIATCSTEILGNAIRVKFTNGATATASNVRANFYLRPI